MAIDPQSTFWYLNDVPGEFISPWSWAQTRGPNPYVTSFFCSDDRFEALKNPVTLTIGAPDATMAGSSLAIFENLYLLEKQRSAKGLREYTLADVRWLLASGEFTGSFNILGYKDRYRPDSLRGGVEKYTRQQAVQVALAELIVSISAREGRVIVPSPRITFDLAADSALYEKLPNNLGNSAGGGWVGAGLSEFLPALLGGAADLVPARGGHLRITDKHAAVVNGIDTGLILLDGVLGKKEIRWQKPRKCIVQFEQRIGDTFRVVQGALDAAGLVDNDPRALTLENVIPKYVEGGLLAENSGVSVSQYQTIDEYLAEPYVVLAGISEEQIRKRMLAPIMIPRENLTAPERARAEVIESTIRAAWRRWWRVSDTDKPTNTRRRFADIQLGVLQSDGTSDPVGVICDYEKHFRFQSTPDDPNMSTPVFDSASPFSAYWHSEKDLVIEIDQPYLAPSLAAVYLGALVERIKIPTEQEMLDYLEGTTVLECLGEFDRRFTMRIYYHGLWVASDDPVRKRLFEVTYPLFADGEIDSVTTLYSGTTANWLRKHNEDDFKLLNAEAIYLAAADRTAQIKKSYEQQRAGDVTFGGVDVLARTGIEPVGDLHEISINIGTGGKNFEIRTNLMFRPYVEPELEYPDLLEELHPSKVG